jgi:hypothetical protein
VKDTIPDRTGGIHAGGYGEVLGQQQRRGGADDEFGGAGRREAAVPESLEIRKHLSAADPSSASRQRVT